MARKISKRSKRRLMTFGIISVFAIIYFCATLSSYIYNYISLKKEENALKSELLLLKDEKENLKVEIQKLNDPSYVIRYAKEKFLYSVDGEYVIKLDSDKIEASEYIEDNNNIYFVIIPIIVCLLMLFFVKRKKLVSN